MNVQRRAYEITDTQDYQQVLVNIENAVTESKLRVSVVMTSHDVETASHYVKSFGSLAKRIESIRKSITEPINQDLKEINSLFKSLNSMYEDEEKRLKNLLLEYNSRQKAIEMERVRQEREKLKRESQPDTIIPESVPVMPKLSQKNSSGVGVMRLKRWEITDFDLIPREYLIVNETMINGLRKLADFDTESPIPGIKFTTEDSIRR